MLAEAFRIRARVSAAQFVDSVEKLGGDDIDKVTKSLDRFKDKADVEFNLRAVISYKDALADLRDTGEDLLKGATGKGFSEFVAGEINAVAKGLKDAATELKGRCAICYHDMGNNQTPVQRRCWRQRNRGSGRFSSTVSTIRRSCGRGFQARAG